MTTAVTPGRYVVFVGVVTFALVAAAHQGRATDSGHLRPDPLQVAAVVAGRVIDADSSKPVPRSDVTLVALRGSDSANASEGRVVQRQIAADDGRFAFGGVPPGWYSVTASHPLYTDVRSDGPSAEGPARSFAVTTGEIRTEFVIELRRGASLEGSVTDDLGEPLAGVRVRAFRRFWLQGKEHFPLVATGDTDDRGRYRIAALDAGEYLLAVTSTHVTVPSSLVDPVVDGDAAAAAALRTALSGEERTTGSLLLGWQARAGWLVRSRPASPVVRLRADGDGTVVYPTTFYPQARNSLDASLVRVQPGDALTGVNIAMASRRGVSVSGWIRDNEVLDQLLVVSLVRANTMDAADVGGETAVSLSHGSGAFRFEAVPAGRYLLAARARDSTGYRSISQIAPLTIGDADVADLQLFGDGGRTVAGRLVLDGASPPAPVEVWLERLDGFSWPNKENAWGKVASSDRGEFLTDPVPAGWYELRTSRLAGWRIESIVADRRKLNGTRVDLRSSSLTDLLVTLTDRPSVVSGRVIGPAGVDTANCIVVFFDTNPAFLGANDSLHPVLRVAASDRAGQYRVEELPVGTYGAVALRQLPRLTPATVRQIRSRPTVQLVVDGPGTHTLDVPLSVSRLP